MSSNCNVVSDRLRPYKQGTRDPSVPLPEVGQLILIRVDVKSVMSSIPSATLASTGLNISTSAGSWKEEGENHRNSYHIFLLMGFSRNDSNNKWFLKGCVVRSYTKNGLSEPSLQLLPNRHIPLPLGSNNTPATPQAFGQPLFIANYEVKKPCWLIATIHQVCMGTNGSVRVTFNPSIVNNQFCFSCLLTLFVMIQYRTFDPPAKLDVQEFDHVQNYIAWLDDEDAKQQSAVTATSGGGNGPASNVPKSNPSSPDRGTGFPSLPQKHNGQNPGPGGQPSYTGNQHCQRPFASVYTCLCQHALILTPLSF